MLAVLSSADKKLSFGRTTYPHQVLRVLLLEQVYRAIRLIGGQCQK
ncbi:23S rRNA (pseudouridine(1915)-N(3))-methyltransferase RlmH [Paenibacillus sp. N3.4]|nr:23S rRNA (pseudouridine(1915)-N(3))-methyltransferase RlmH [Paenibacillus sp. N3.4]